MSTHNTVKIEVKGQSATLHLTRKNSWRTVEQRQFTLPLSALKRALKDADIWVPWSAS